jgi:hypothetical protein
MILLMETPELRGRLALAAREEIIAKFSADRMVTNTILVYEDVLRRKS